MNWCHSVWRFLLYCSQSLDVSVYMRVMELTSFFPGRGECPLALIWVHYYYSLALAETPDHVLQCYHSNLIKLPWQQYLVDLPAMGLMMQVRIGVTSSDIIWHDIAQDDQVVSFKLFCVPWRHIPFVQLEGHSTTLQVREREIRVLCYNIVCYSAPVLNWLIPFSLILTFYSCW